MQVRAAVAPLVDVRPAGVRQRSDRPLDAHDQPAEGGGVLVAEVAEVAEVEVCARDQQAERQADRPGAGCLVSCAGSSSLNKSSE